ncbi:MAG: type II secretion system major pseudopilin GspG [Gammaproteobacteria bacterium]|nr:type II secretion system major pseudopilin GspG [Pseudomonadota bacterium]MCH9663026.1 type II secretion system major pseudopilin GspG [Gammaproteobacteria bacterium]
MNNSHKKRQSGFTLIEILVVIVIIGLLAGIVVPNLVGQVDEAKITTARSNMSSISNALTMYRLKNGRYPSSDQGLQALTAGDSLKRFMDRIPKDPWDNEYQYISPGQNGDYELYSFGGDGAAGGTDAGSDIYHGED